MDYFNEFYNDEWYNTSTIPNSLATTNLSSFSSYNQTNSPLDDQLISNTNFMGNFDNDGFQNNRFMNYNNNETNINTTTTTTATPKNIDTTTITTNDAPRLASSVYRLQHKKRSNIESLYPQNGNSNYTNSKISTDQHTLLPEIFFPNGEPSKSKKLRSSKGNEYGAQAQNTTMSLDAIEGFYMAQVNMASGVLGGLDDDELGLNLDSGNNDPIFSNSLYLNSNAFVEEVLPSSAAPDSVPVPQSSPTALPTPIVNSLVQTQVVAGNEAGAANVENRLIDDDNESEDERRAKRRLTDKSRRAKIKDGLDQLRTLATLSGNQSTDQASVVMSSVHLLKQLVKQRQDLKSELSNLERAQISYNSILTISQKAAEAARQKALTANTYASRPNVNAPYSQSMSNDVCSQHIYPSSNLPSRMHMQMPSNNNYPSYGSNSAAYYAQMAQLSRLYNMDSSIQYR
jgi:hypothetical protein